MRDRKTEAELLEAQCLRAAQKVERQGDAVRKMNGSAQEHPEQLNLLNEMRRNKAVIDFNRVLFEYENEDKSRFDAGQTSPPRGAFKCFVM